MSEVKIGQVVRVRLSDHTGSLGPWTFAAVLELGRVHPIHGREVKCLLDPEGPHEAGGHSTVTRYTGASRFDCTPAVARDLPLDVQYRLAGVFASLTTQSQAGDASVTKQYQAPDIQTVCLRQTKRGKFNELKGKQLAAILEHPDVLAAIKESFAGAESTALEDAKRMLAAACQELDQERAKNSELYGKLTALTTRHDALVQRYNLLEQRKSTAPALIESVVLKAAGEKRGFVLWNPASSMPPKVIYRSLEEAKRIQELMANREKDQVFHIMPIGPGLKIVKPVAAQRVVC